MSDIESAVRDASQTDNRFRAKLVAAHRTGLGGAGLQHLCRRQTTLNKSLPYCGGTGPGQLNLLIDAIGIKAEDEEEWSARKHGGPKRRIWRKIHIGIDEKKRWSVRP